MKLKESMTDELTLKKQGEARTVAVLSQLQKKLEQLEKDVMSEDGSHLENAATSLRRCINYYLLSGRSCRCKDSLPIARGIAI